jgi:hypothetical protein
MENRTTPFGIYVFTGKWVFKIKKNEKGDIIRFKSR